MSKTRHPFSTSASPMAAARWLLPPPRAEQQEIGAHCEPAIACGDRHHLRLAHHWNGVEVEACERLADGQSGGSGRKPPSYNVQTAVDAATGLIVHHEVTTEPAATSDGQSDEGRGGG
jgi:hypothetical protein